MPARRFTSSYAAFRARAGDTISDKVCGGKLSRGGRQRNSQAKMCSAKPDPAESRIWRSAPPPTPDLLKVLTGKTEREGTYADREVAVGDTGFTAQARGNEIVMRNKKKCRSCEPGVALAEMVNGTAELGRSAEV